MSQSWVRKSYLTFMKRILSRLLMSVSLFLTQTMLSLLSQPIWKSCTRRGPRLFVSYSSTSSSLLSSLRARQTSSFKRYGSRFLWIRSQLADSAIDLSRQLYATLEKPQPCQTIVTSSRVTLKSYSKFWCFLTSLWLHKTLKSTRTSLHSSSRMTLRRATWRLDAAIVWNLSASCQASLSKRSAILLDSWFKLCSQSTFRIKRLTGKEWQQSLIWSLLQVLVLIHISMELRTLESHQSSLKATFNSWSYPSCKLCRASL